jgi:hypothetical protein
LPFFQNPAESAFEQGDESVAAERSAGALVRLQRRVVLGAEAGGTANSVSKSTTWRIPTRPVARHEKSDKFS